MTEMGIIVLLLAGILLLPLVLLAQWFASQEKAKGTARRVVPADPEQWAGRPQRRPHRSQVPVLQPELVKQAAPFMRSHVNYIAAADFERAGFDYTIKSHPAILPRPVFGREGFAEVQILLYTRNGASLLTHRKICLN